VPAKSESRRSDGDPTNQLCHCSGANFRLAVFFNKV
jgi:hypothetical protein